MSVPVTILGEHANSTRGKAMAQEVESEERVTLLLGASQSITVGPGSVVLIEESEGEAFGAVIERIQGCTVELTFIPPGKPRNVPLGMIACSAGDEPVTIDLSSVPAYQPAPNIAPYRSRRVKADV